MESRRVGGVQHGIIRSQQPVKSDMVPPVGSQPTARLDRRGRQIWRRQVSRKAGRREIRDADGNVQYWTGASGEKLRPKYQAEMETVWEEFVLEDGGDGMVRMVAPAVATPEEVLAEEQQAILDAQRAKADRLLLRLAEADIDPDELASALSEGRVRRRRTAPAADATSE